MDTARPVTGGTRALLGVFVVLTALATNQLYVLSGTPPTGSPGRSRHR